MPSNNPPHSDKRPHDLRSTLTKSQILDGARQVFLLNGYAGASIDQIINQSGVSKGSIYHHFDSKDVLFRLADRRGSGEDRAGAAEHRSGRPRPVLRLAPDRDGHSRNPEQSGHHRHPAPDHRSAWPISWAGRGVPPEQPRPNRGRDRSLSRRPLGFQRYSDRQQPCRGGGVREAMPDA